MQPNLVNRLIGTIFVAGLAFVICFTLYSSLPATSIESISPQVEKLGWSSDSLSQKPLTFIPAIGLGTWLSKKNEVTAAVKAAIDVGYRHIDAAMIYGNEKEVGQGIIDSGVPRSEIWITSKLFNNDHHPEDVEPAIRKTLSDLKLDYLDLYLMHWPVAMKDGKLDTSVTYIETYHAMEKLVGLGLTKNIGISNFAQHEVEDILSAATIPPAAHEFETHPYLQQQEFVDWNIKQGIQVIAYSPFANTNPTYRDREGDIPSILEDKYWIDLAKTKNATVPQTILAWGMQRGTIVIPKSVHEERIIENFGSKKVRFTDEELKAVGKMNKELRLNNPSVGRKLFDDLEGSEVKGEL